MSVFSRGATNDVMMMSSDTRNDLADAGEGYQNITVAWQPAQPSLEFLQYVTNQIEPGDTCGDCIYTA